jgi:hypothetical protein
MWYQPSVLVLTSVLPWTPNCDKKPCMGVEGSNIGMKWLSCLDRSVLLTKDKSFHLSDTWQVTLLIQMY